VVGIFEEDEEAQLGCNKSPGRDLGLSRARRVVSFCESKAG
jgi:hypothetical protein